MQPIVARWRVRGMFVTERTSVIEKVIAHIDAHKEDHVQRLLDLLRIPSVSTDPGRKADVLRGAEWFNRLFAEAGIESDIVETAGHPAVLADTGPVEDGGDRGRPLPTLLVYGHYDVQPAGDESLWDSPPFDPTIRDGAIFARGSADDKGQVLTHVLATSSFKQVAGRLPIRVKFLIEGEEEVGSANLPGLLRAQRDRLACDYVVLSDTPKLDANTPAITYGTKGLIYKEIVVTGPRQDLHSGSYGGTLVNPGNALAAIIASLHDADNRVTVPGYYDNVREISADERKRLGELPFDENAYLTSMGAPALEGEKGYSTLERRWARPTLDVNGLLGGFTGEGASTIIPAKMSAKVSMRIVPDQDPEKTSAAFDKAVRSAAPKGVRVEILTHAVAAPYLCPTDSPGMSAAKQAVEAGFGKRPVLIREGGTLPILPLFKEVLGADSLMIGMCHPNCNAHGPNEFFTLADLHDGTKAAAHLIHTLADQPG